MYGLIRPIGSDPIDIVELVLGVDQVSAYILGSMLNPQMVRHIQPFVRIDCCC